MALPKEVGPRDRSPEGNDTNQTAAATTTEADSFSHCKAVRRRRDASRRLPVLECGCANRVADPWAHRCAPDPVTELAVDGYAAAVQHLGTLGLCAAPNIPAMRVLWRRGGDDRRLVSEVASAWEVSA